MRTTSTIAIAAMTLAFAGPVASQPGSMPRGGPMHDGRPMQGAGPTMPGGPSAGRTSAPAVPAMGETMVYRGTVRAIDPAARTLVVEGDEGGATTMRIGGDVRNFDNVRVGDRVRVRYTEAVAQTIAEHPDSAIRQRIEADAATQAPPGGRPGMRALERVTVVANVVAVDREGGRVTLLGTGREPLQLRVPDERMLSRLDRGDQVVATYMQSAAVSIEPGDGRAVAR